MIRALKEAISAILGGFVQFGAISAQIRSQKHPVSRFMGCYGTLFK
jgi:hypothetical protein